MHECPQASDLEISIEELNQRRLNNHWITKLLSTTETFLHLETIFCRAARKPKSKNSTEKYEIHVGRT